MADSLPTRLGDLLDSAGSRFGLDGARQVGLLWRRWSEIVGPDIAAHAQPSSLRRGILRIRTDTPGWATEIKYLAEEIARRVDEVAGRGLVSEVRVWVGPSDRPPAGRVGQSHDLESAPNASPRERVSDPVEAVRLARESWARSRGQKRPG